MSDISNFMFAIWPGITNIFAAVVGLGLLVFVHEFGHFLVAKLSGVGVTKFSLGFGKKLVGWKIGETDYMVSAFPLGGYVKMVGGEGEDMGEELTPEEKKRSFLAQPVWKRMAIVFAGPVFNIFLAVFLCYVLFITGFPTLVAKVTEVIPGSPGQAAGFVAGDVIEKMDGSGVDDWEQAAAYIKGHPGKEIAFEVKRGNATLSITATPAVEDGKGKLGLIGSAVIAAVMGGMPADKAGIQSKDRIVSVGGVKVASWDDMAEAVKASPGRQLAFTINRDGRLMDLKVTPVLKTDEHAPGKPFGQIGAIAGAETEKVRYGPIDSIGLGAEKTMYMMSFTVDVLSKIIKGKEKASDLGGPIAIVQLSGRQAREGFTDYVLFLALLSVNLGVINLFPIPILDGGLIMFLGIEAVIRKPLSLRMREAAQQAGLFILIALMIFVFYNDIMRWLGFIPTWK